MAESAKMTTPEEEQAGGCVKTLDIDNAAPREEQSISVKCVYCGEGLVRDELPRFSRAFGIIVLIVGLLLSIFMLLLLGLPLVVIGAYMASASRSVWACEECGAVVDRNEK